MHTGSTGILGGGFYFFEIMKAITRSSAKSLGLKRYFTGKKCKNGHIAERSTRNGSCVECRRLYKNNLFRRLGKPVRFKLSKESEKRRAEAKRNGEKTFFPVEKCSKGHSSPRDVKLNRCIECVRIKSREYVESNREAQNKKHLEWHHKNKEKNNKYSRDYYQRNIEDQRKKKIKYCIERHNRLKNDPMYMLKRRMSGGIRQSLKQGKKEYSWEKLVPYTKEELEKHLKKTMPKGYSWKHFLSGELHIDHIIPVSAFNITSSDCIDFQRCWAIENLRLLPAIENLKKGNRIDEFQLNLPI